MNIQRQRIQVMAVFPSKKDFEEVGGPLQEFFSQVQLNRALTLGEALSMGKSFDCILAAWNLEGWKGIEIIRAFAAQHPSKPLILVTPPLDISFLLDFIRAGAQDVFSLDSLSGKHMFMSIRSAIERQSVLNEYQATIERLEEEVRWLKGKSSNGRMPIKRTEYESAKNSLRSVLQGLTLETINERSFDGLDDNPPS